MFINKDLFSNQQLRELNLVKLMSQKKQAYDYKSICHYLDCSFMTLQTEIAHLSTFPEIKAFPYIEPHLSLSYKREFGPQKLYQSILLEAPSLRLLEILFFEDPESLDCLADQLFISLSTLKRLIKKTNCYLENFFNCHIDIKQLGLVGQEKQIRLFYLKYFSEAYDMHQWPFASMISESVLSDLIDLIVTSLDTPMDRTHYRHLKVLAAVNLVRYSQGFTLANSDLPSQFLYQQIKDLQPMAQLAQRFLESSGLSLDSTALSELFSAYSRNYLFFNDYNLSTAALEPLAIPADAWQAVLEKLQEQFGLALQNREELCRILQEATILGEEDRHQNYLVFDHKEPYLNYFRTQYPELCHVFSQALLLPFLKRGLSCPEKMRGQLLYIVLVYWDNLFLQLSHSIQKQKLLIIESGRANLGQFLQAFTGQYFDITIHDELEIDMENIRQNYDLVLTDVALEQTEDLDIYFFSQLVPHIALAQLNDHLRDKIQAHFKAKCQAFEGQDQAS
ncbi:transcriptional regulator [Streptococcus penaeicida]|uniref:Transcriptional regulator n=1 Tax=Streptococcus penaeicida TaxID=1765960 RepID=A0A2N8LAP2_9STRE|nr:helix-turn-helix domain-containing protein [Streptococcus penaeicida]PND47225.1 transcriptional regulator [Streptococcus penaeicida]